MFGAAAWLQAKGTLPPEVLDTQVDPAAFELSGHLVLKRAADFEAVSEDSCWRLLECASLDEVRTVQPQEIQPPCFTWCCVMRSWDRCCLLS